MSDQAKKRAIGLAVLIIVVVGLPLVLSQVFGPGNNKPATNGETRQITIQSGSIETESNQVGSGDKQPAGQSTGQSSMPDFAQNSGSAATGGTRQTSQSAPPTKTARGQNASIPGQSSRSPAKTDANRGGDRSRPAGVERSAERVSATSEKPATQQPLPREDRQGAPQSASSQSNAADSSVNKTRGGGNSRSTPAASDAAGEGELLVQLASFKTLERAKNFMAQIDSGYTSFYRVGEVKGVTYYRVQVGPFASRDKAERVAAELATESRKPYVVPR